MKDHPKRSILKAVSWRILATFITICLVFWVTGKITLSLGIGLIEVLVKMLTYYLHERWWQRIKWGKVSVLKNTEKQ